MTAGPAAGAAADLLDRVAEQVRAGTGISLEVEGRQYRFLIAAVVRAQVIGGLFAEAPVSLWLAGAERELERAYRRFAGSDSLPGAESSRE